MVLRSVCCTSPSAGRKSRNGSMFGESMSRSWELGGLLPRSECPPCRFGLGETVVARKESADDDYDDD